VEERERADERPLLCAGYLCYMRGGEQRELIVTRIFNFPIMVKTKGETI
jgi:hypothetical protein